MLFRNMLLGSAFVLMALAGCKPKVDITYLKPAQVDLKGIKRLAVGGVLMPAARIPSAILLKEDMENAIYNSGRFELVEKQLTADSLTRVGFVFNSLFDETSASKMAKTIPDSVIVFAVITNYQDGSKVETDSNGNKYRVNFVDIEGQFQMIESETGRLVATKWLRGYASDRTEITSSLLANVVNNVSSFQYIHDNARADITGQFIRMISPYPVTDRIKMAKDKSIPEVQMGARLIVAGNWAEAIRTLEGARAKYPEDPEVLFNLGVAYQYNFEFDKAIPTLEKAYSIKGKKMYLRQLESCKQLQYDQARLQDQLNEKK
jgi:hypothetical protein